jgi:hypothetical protein
MRTKTFSSLMLAAGLLAFSATALRAQVGINTTGATPNASAILDLNTGSSGTMGFLPPQVALTNVTVAAPVTGAATGIIVYTTTAPTGGDGIGYYYWSGTQWIGMGAGAVSGSGIDNYVARWTPNGTTLGTGLIQDNDTVVSIDTVPYPEITLFVNSGIYNEIGIIGYNYYPDGVGAAGLAIASGGIGIVGEGAAGHGAGVEGEAPYIGVDGLGDTIGVYASGDTAITAYGNYYGISAQSPFLAYYGLGTEVGGEFLDGNGGDVAVLADSGSGYGVLGEGYNEGGYFLDASGDEALLADNNNELGVNAYGFDDGGFFSTYSYDAGTSSYDLEDYAYIADNGDEAGGYFQDGGGDYSYIAYAGSAIVSNVPKSTEIKDASGTERMLFCNESPEVMFEDYGQGQLVNGNAHIDLDPLLAKNVIISEKHPLRVYIQLEGDCNGVFVTNKSVSGFDVKELMHGTSNATFQWHIICNRANEAGAYHNFADKRFPVGPGPIAPKNHAVAKQLSGKKPLLSANTNHANVKKHVNPIKAKLPISAPSQGKN